MRATRTWPDVVLAVERYTHCVVAASEVHEASWKPRAWEAWQPLKQAS